MKLEMSAVEQFNKDEEVAQLEAEKKELETKLAQLEIRLVEQTKGLVTIYGTKENIELVRQIDALKYKIEVLERKLKQQGT